VEEEEGEMIHRTTHLLHLRMESSKLMLGGALNVKKRPERTILIATILSRVLQEVAWRATPLLQAPPRLLPPLMECLLKPTTTPPHT